MMEGAGVQICRTVGTGQLRSLDPYLMLGARAPVVQRLLALNTSLITIPDSLITLPLHFPY